MRFAFLLFPSSLLTFSLPQVTVMEVFDGPFVNPTLTVAESTSGYGDVYVSGTRDLILAAAACRR